MRELGTPKDVVERCLNHTESDEIVATYQLSELRAEMQAGWLRLGDYLDNLLRVAMGDVSAAEVRVELPPLPEGDEIDDDDDDDNDS